MSKGPKAKAAAFDQAASELPVAVAKARVESTIYSEAYEQCILQLRLLHSIMARERAKSKSAMLRVDELRAIVDEGEVLKPAPEPNPHDHPGLARGGGEWSPPSTTAASGPYSERGGSCRRPGAGEGQFLAAAKYCHLYERTLPKPSTWE